MKPWTLRNKSRISYSESIEPPLDNYVFCEKCADFVYEYCALHGPLLVVPDNEVPECSELLATIPKAALTIPSIFLHIAPSYIPGAGLGVFCTLSLPMGVRFGPYRGDVTTEIQSDYCWQIYGNQNKQSHVVDGADLNRSNWMRYVNCARHYSEQNLIAYQYEGQMYYRTIKLIPRFTELLVFYGGEFANTLRIDLKNYNHPDGAWKLQYVIPNRIDNEDIDKNSDSESYIDIDFNNDDTSMTSTKESDYEENLSQDIDTNADLATTSNSEVDEEDEANDNNLDLANNELANNDNFENEFNVHSNDSTKDKTNIVMINGLYTCMHCDFKRPYKRLVLRHILNNHKTKCYACHICNIKFVEQKILHAHIATHITLTHSCNLCNFKTTNKRYLSRHSLTHKEKQFACNICNFKTNFLRRHMKTHEASYSCSQCDFKCSSIVILGIHDRVHSNVQLFQCNHCYYNSPSKKNFQSHIARHCKKTTSIFENSSEVRVLNNLEM